MLVGCAEGRSPCFWIDRGANDRSRKGKAKKGTTDACFTMRLLVRVQATRKKHKAVRLGRMAMH